MILGLDVSTSVTGVCLLHNDGSFASCFKIDLRKISDFVDKCNFVNEKLPSNAIDHIFIEDKLSGFSGGMTSQQTIMKLAAFNGAVTYISSFNFLVQPIHIHPSTIKATMKWDGLIIPKGVKGKGKKKFVAQFVRDLSAEFPYEETKAGNLKSGVDDQADAYCVARAGYLKFICDKQKK